MKNKTGKLKITKEMFIEIIGDIQKQFEYDDKCADAFQTIFQDSYGGQYFNNLLLNGLLKILKNAFNDNMDTWIEYFIWDLEFGKTYKDGCVIDKDGSFINLSDSEKLFDFLIENNCVSK